MQFCHCDHIYWSLSNAVHFYHTKGHKFFQLHKKRWRQQGNSATKNVSILPNTMVLLRHVNVTNTVKLLHDKQTLKETLTIPKQNLLLYSHIIDAFPWIQQSYFFTRKTNKSQNSGPHNLMSSIITVCSNFWPCE